ncbi:hypothetical protein PMIN06_007931 [Paraphaeosphaeria minitans]
MQRVRGITILRSHYWDAKHDGREDLEAANKNVGDVEMEDVFDAAASAAADEDAPEVKMSCVYHQHTEDRACWMLKNRLVNGGVWPTEDLEE